MSFNYNIKRDNYQQRYCCVPYCLKLIIEAEDLMFDDFSQKYIASYCDLRIPPKDSKLLIQFASATLSNSDDEYGCFITDLNKQFFIPTHLPLEETYLPFRRIKDCEEFEEIITRNIDSNNHVIIPILYGNLMNDKSIDPKMCKHVILAENYKNNSLKVVIPSEQGSFKENFSFQQVYNSRVKDNGLWIIRRKDN